MTVVQGRGVGGEGQGGCRGCGEVTHPGGSAGLETGSRTLVSGDGAETCNPWMRSPRRGRRRGPWPSPGARHQVDDGEGEVE